MSRLDANTLRRLESQAGVLKALAHPTRLYLMEVLSQGEKCVCELTEMVGADISTVSKHLALLKKAGIVADEKRGSMVFYTLKTPCALRFFQCVESVQKSSAES
jgi:ArsR family transcriptional regulator